MSNRGRRTQVYRTFLAVCQLGISKLAAPSTWRMAALLAAIALPAAADSLNYTKGKWTSAFALGSIPVHFIVAPCDSSQPNAPRDSLHSQILWWRGKTEFGPFGGVIFWKTPTDQTDSFADTTATVFPAGNIYSRHLASPGRDIFCGGHTRFGADGKLFVSGGTDSNSAEVGIKQNSVFKMATREWDTSVDPLNMNYRRWYSTSTTLRSGKILITSGSSFVHTVLFGGLRDTSSIHALAANVVTRLGMTAAGTWDGQVSDAVSANNPAPREFQALVPTPGLGISYYFGGRDSLTNPSAPTTFRDTHTLYVDRNGLGGDYSYTWKTLTPIGDKYPPSRFLQGATHDSLNDLIVFGGGYYDTAAGHSNFNDLWELEIEGQVYAWKQVVFDTTGLNPGHRAAHGMLWSDSTRTMYLFGGATNPGSAPDDSNVYSLKIKKTGLAYSAAWNTLPISSTLRPGPLANFSVLLDPRLRLYRTSPDSAYFTRALFFGGRDHLNRLKNDLWELWFVKDSTGQYTGVWQKDSTTGSIPHVRMNQGLAFEPSLNRLVVIGGDTTMTRQKTDDIRAIILDDVYPGSGVVPSWKSFGTDGANPIGRVSGLTADYSGADVFTRIPEIYNPATGASPAFTAYASDPHLADWYPQMFVVPDVNPNHHPYVFEAGPRTDSWLFDADTTDGHRWLPVDQTMPTQSIFKGGSAVLYRVGVANKVMKCGTRDTEVGSAPVTDTTMTIDLTSSPSMNRASLAWHVESRMKLKRVNHTLVLLPTGEVLVFGGTDQAGNNDEDDGMFNFRQPEVWHPGDGSTAASWDTLLSDPFKYRRGYHSSAVLLPDGRVLTGGGNILKNQVTQDSMASVQIFSPPYLFDSGGHVLKRPKYITGGGPTSYQGDFETFVFDTTVDSLVLLRGSATTHGFNQEQRRIPMFRNNSTHTDVNSTGYHEFTVAMPTDSAQVPPGDYMVFALKSGYAPSIARWVRFSKPLGWDPNDLLRPGKVLWSVSTVGCDHTFSWTTPADDSTYAISGKVRGYLVRYVAGSTSPCTTCWSTFNSMTDYAPSLSYGDPGSTESFNANDLTIGTTYKFQAVSYDDRRPSPYQTSGLSSVVTIHENGCDDGSFASGGGLGGDGLSAQRIGQSFAAHTSGHPMASLQGGGSGEGSMLDGLASGEARTEHIMLTSPPKNLGSALRVRLRRGKVGAMTLLSTRLESIDVPDGTDPLVLPTRVLSGSTLGVTHVARQDGADLTTQVAGDDNPYHGIAGDTLLVTLPTVPGASTATPFPMTIRAAGLPPIDAAPKAGYLVQVPNEQGGWKTLGRQVPHDHFETFGTDSVGGIFARIVLLTSLDISAVGRMTPGAATPSSQTAGVTAMHHSRLGDLEPGALGDSSGVTMAAHDTLMLDFANGFAEPTNGSHRMWVLELTGRGAARSGVASARNGTSESIPVRFSLEQNRPNPFSGATTLRFGLPTPSAVRVELYDLQGRRVCTLANGRFPEGWHTLSWDRSLAREGKAPAGVYLCRMAAGAFREVRKLIVYP